MINKIFPRNLTAQAAYNVPGNPPSTRPESGVGNCYPGLEYDHRNLDRRFFPGLVFEFVSQEDAATPNPELAGARLSAVDTSDVDLTTSDPRYAERAEALSAALGGAVGAALGASGPAWFIASLTQGERTIEMRDTQGVPLDGLVVWRLVRSLRPGPVTVNLAQRGGQGTETLAGFRRRYTDEKTGVINLSYQPGELTQSLCSPWMHDFRDCACTYWASNHPDIVLAEAAPGESTLPSGSPDDPLRGDTKLDWLRDDRTFDASSAAGASIPKNRLLEISHFEINERWQDLAVVLENREIESLYLPRRRASDDAKPYASPKELVDHLIDLGKIEHLVALLYLYARYSILDPDEAKALSKETGRFPTLADDVEFARHKILEVAIGEMQHLRWANHILFGISKAGLVPDWKYEPDVLAPALVIPGAGKIPSQPAKLAPASAATIQLFVDVEEPSGAIDGRYSRVTATLKQPTYPENLYQMAANIVRDGEQHFLDFRDVQQVLAAYGDDRPVYLRAIEEGNPAAPEVAAALATYQKISSDLYSGYQMGYVVNMVSLAEARRLMFTLDEQSEALAKKGIGVPYLSLFTGAKQR